MEFVEFLHGGNSGAGAISLADFFGAERVILLGYDCQYDVDRRHWHGDHPPNLANAGRIDAWQVQFAEMAAALAHLEIINCSRRTALAAWPRGDLAQQLKGE